MSLFPDIWLAKDFVVDLSSKEILDQTTLTFDPKFSDKMSRPSKSLIEIDLYEKLNKTKDNISNYTNWSDISRLSNPYEKVHKIARLGSKTSSKSSRPSSRAFFKLYEMLKYFNIKINDTGVSASLCDAPGGYIQALLKEFPDINWYAQSLYVGSDALKIDKDVDIPERWLKGGDNTGNLYNLDNILAFREQLLEKTKSLADIITADGGFSTEFDPNNQEQLCFQLIFAEIVAALHCQKISGTFICKIFDTITSPTAQLIILLRYFYTKVFIIKPRTSRYSNSEKYLVCIGFRGISTDLLKQIGLVLANPLWYSNETSKTNSHKTNSGKPFCRGLSLDILNTDDDFYKILFEHNVKIINNQIKYIERSFEYSNFSSRQLQYIEALQNEKATDFCKSFGLISDSNVCSHQRLKNISNTSLSTLTSSSTLITSSLTDNIKKCENCKKLIL